MRGNGIEPVHQGGYDARRVQEDGVWAFRWLVHNLFIIPLEVIACWRLCAQRTYAMLILHNATGALQDQAFLLSISIHRINRQDPDEQ